MVIQFSIHMYNIYKLKVAKFQSIIYFRKMWNAPQPSLNRVNIVVPALVVSRLHNIHMNCSYYFIFWDRFVRVCSTLLYCVFIFTVLFAIGHLCIGLFVLLHTLSVVNLYLVYCKVLYCYIVTFCEGIFA